MKQLSGNKTFYSVSLRENSLIQAQWVKYQTMNLRGTVENKTRISV